MAKKKKVETVEDILDRIQEDIDLIREKCVCNGDEDYSSDDSEDWDDSDTEEDEDWLSNDDEDKS